MGNHECVKHEVSKVKAKLPEVRLSGSFFARTCERLALAAESPVKPFANIVGYYACRDRDKESVKHV